MSNMVVKKNPLINAKIKLNPLELKIILSVISMIDKKDSDFWTYKVKLSDLDADNRHIKKACKALMSKPFEIPSLDGKDWFFVSWFSYIGYKNQDGFIEFSFDPRLKPYLYQIKENFTSYHLKSVLPMRSTYSIRIYELLKQYEGFGSRTFNLDELQELLIVPQSYRIWRAFNRRVLEPAQKEINEHSDLEISYEPIKQNRKTTAISFIIAPKMKNKSLTQYKAYIRANFKNKVLYEDSITGICLSVSDKGYLYDQKKPDYRISTIKSLALWEFLYTQKIYL